MRLQNTRIDEEELPEYAVGGIILCDLNAWEDGKGLDG